MNLKFTVRGIIAVFIMISITLGTGPMTLQSYATTKHEIPGPPPPSIIPPDAMKAPSVISGNNVYLVWPNNLGNVNSNYEICFRVSNDNGATFGPITNISNTNTYESLNP